MASHLNTANSCCHHVFLRHFRFQKCLYYTFSHLFFYSRKSLCLRVRGNSPRGTQDLLPPSQVYYCIKRHIRFQTCLHKQQPIIRIYKGIIHEKKPLHWLDENLEEFLLVVMLAAMTLIMGIQIFSRYALGQSLSWSEEVTRFLFIWSGFLSVSYCSKKCLSIKIEQFVAAFPRRGKALFQGCQPHL